MNHCLLTTCLTVACTFAMAAEEKGFVPLFNGRDLNGWVNVNCAPETWSVREGVIHCTGLPTGALRTPLQYENFILELEWRHLTRAGNAGVFIWSSPIAAPAVPFLRAIEVQVLDHGYAENHEKAHGKKSESFTTHGDVFPIHGSTMRPFGRHNGQRSFPSSEHSKGSPDWNHYRVICTNGVLRLSVNGHEVSGGENCNYGKGYIGLESEGAPVEFRNLRIKELPSGNAPANQAAPEDNGLRSLFTGLDLRGWKTNEATAPRWIVRGEHLVLRGGTANPKATLWSEKEFGDAEFVFDCRPSKPAAGQAKTPPILMVRGVELKLTEAISGSFRRYSVTVQQGEIIIRRGEQELQRTPLPAGAPARGSFGLRDVGAGMELMNLYARELSPAASSQQPIQKP